MKKLILALFFAASASAFSGHASAQLIIANPSVKSSTASKSDIRDIFTGAASSLKDGSHLTPILLKTGPTTDQFLTEYIGKTDAAFRASWRSLVFSGQATMPRAFDSDAAVVAYVAQNPGAIGYIGKSSPHEGVKVLEVH
jgi:ABC-type phosphate transport system substrate-binding protein